MSDTPPETPSFSRGGRFGQALNSVVGIACLFALVAMVNYLGIGWYQRWDWSKSGRFELSPMTERLLQTITNEVEVVVCFDPRANEEVFGWTKALLEQYAQRTPRIRLSFIDTARAPGQAAQVIATNQLTTLKAKDFILFNSGGHRQVVFANELSDRDQGTMGADGQLEFKRIAFRGEQAFTSKLLAVTHPRQQKAYFVTGHNELDPGASGENGYSAFATMLKNEVNVDWAKVNLRGTNDLSDASLLIFAGPSQVRFEEDELLKLHRYLRQGGRALFLMGNVSLGHSSGLEVYLTNWNVVSPFGLVQDPDSVATENDLLTAKINSNHPITRPLATEDPPMPIRLVLPRLVSSISGGGPASGIKVDVLASTSDAGRHFDYVGGKFLTNSYSGSLPMMVAVEQGGIAGVSAAGTTRLVVIGDSYCFNNQLLDSGANRYFAGFVVNWLLDRPSATLQIPPKPVKEYRLVMSAAQQRRLNWILLGGLPGGALLLGGLVWLKRRR
jgi:hypothetical protein